MHALHVGISRTDLALTPPSGTLLPAAAAAPACVSAQAPSCFGSPPALQPSTPGSVCWDLLQGIKVGWPKHLTPPKARLAPAAVLAKLLPPQLPNSWSLLLNMVRWTNGLVHLIQPVAKHSSSAGAPQAVQLSPTQGNNCRKADRTESWLQQPLQPNRHKLHANSLREGLSHLLAAANTSTATELPVPQHYNHGFWISSSLHYSWYLTHSHLTAPNV